MVLPCIFSWGKSKRMDLSVANIKIEKRPAGRGRALFQRRCFYYKKYIWNRPLTPNNLHSRGTKLHEGKESKQPDNKHVIYFYLMWRTLHIEQVGEMRERKKRAIKTEIYMEVALFCHTWSYGSWQEPSGHISSRWRGSRSAPPPRLRQWPLPSFYAWPLCITTHSHSAHIPRCLAKRLQQTSLNVIQRGSGNDL